MRDKYTFMVYIFNSTLTIFKSIKSRSKTTNNMNNKSALDKFPNRVKYYLLEWKDDNMEDYMDLFGEKKLHELNGSELNFLFKHATRSDRKMVFPITGSNLCACSRGKGTDTDDEGNEYCIDCGKNIQL